MYVFLEVIWKFVAWTLGNVSPKTVPSTPNSWKTGETCVWARLALPFLKKKNPKMQNECVLQGLSLKSKSPPAGRKGASTSKKKVRRGERKLQIKNGRGHLPFRSTLCLCDMNTLVAHKREPRCFQDEASRGGCFSCHRPCYSCYRSLFIMIKERRPPSQFSVPQPSLVS